MKFSSLPYVAQLAVHTLIVAGITQLGLMISPVESSLLFVWSPAGLSIVLLTFSGVRFLPAVFIGTAVSFIPAVHSIPLGTALAAGSVLEAFTGYLLLRRAGFNIGFRTFRDVGVLIFIGGGTATLLNALFSTASTVFLAGTNAEGFGLTAILWWTGNLSGLIIVAPLILVLASRNPLAFTMKRIAELLVLILFVHIVSRFVLQDSSFLVHVRDSVKFVLFPFAIWGALRFGLAGSVLTSYVIAVNAILSLHGATHARLEGEPGFDLFVIHLFLIVLGTTSLVLASLTEERENAEKAVERSKEVYRIITERTGQVVYDYDIATGMTRWSGALTDVTQYAPEEFRSINIDEWIAMIHPEDLEKTKEELTSSMRERREFKAEYRLRRKDGTYVNILDRGVFLYRTAADTTAYRMLGTMADISLVHQTMNKLRENEERFRILIEKSADGIILMDRRARVTFVSSSATTVIGYTPEELLNTSILDLLHASEAKKYAFKFGRLAVEAERSEYLLGRFRHKNGEWVHIEGMVTNLLGNATVRAFVANFRNVTDRVNAEERLIRSLQEKDILLKEVHHRVKNNMQVISSLLNLQSASLKNEKILSMFRESQNRVKSMALVHEILYQSQDIASVNFSLYVKQMTASLQKSFGARARDIAVKVRIANIVLDIDSAIPCGLIVNELVSNSIKYAFPLRQDGQIDIELKKKKGAYFLSVHDNGVGLPKKAEQSQSLGLTLVRALSEQLKGELTVTVDRGTTFTVEFPIHQSNTPSNV